MRKVILGKDEPTPKADIVAIFRMEWARITAMMLACESAIRRAGAEMAAHGLPDARLEARVTIMAFGIEGEVAVNASSISDCCRGVPVDEGY